MSDFSVGDRVFLTDDTVPAELRGLAGTVAAVRGDAVHVTIQGAKPIAVSRRFLRHERRRPHRPVAWNA